MRELDEHSITDEVLRRFEGCENPRLKQLLEWSGAPSPRFRAREGGDRGRMGLRDRLPHPHRQDQRPEPAGIHPALGHARRVDAGRRDQQPSRAGRDAIDGARPVLRRGRAVGRAGRRHRSGRQGRRRPSVRRRRRHRSREQTDRGRDRRRLALRRRGVLRRAARRSANWRAARASSPTGRGACASAPRRRPPIRSPTTARSAK